MNKLFEAIDNLDEFTINTQSILKNVIDKFNQKLPSLNLKITGDIDEIVEDIELYLEEEDLDDDGDYSSNYDSFTIQGEMVWDSKIEQAIADYVVESLGEDDFFTSSANMDEEANISKKWSPLGFEGEIPSNMVFKEQHLDDETGTLYWITQSAFSKYDLDRFAKILFDRYDVPRALVTVRDLSTYDLDRDLDNDVLCKIENGRVLSMAQKYVDWYNKLLDDGVIEPFEEKGE